MSNAIVKEPIVDRSTAERLVASVPWFHRVEVMPGVVAPGIVPPQGSYNAKAYVDSLNIENIREKRILELGTWDGPIAFELKYRGADVVASDIQDRTKTGFHVLEKVSGLNIPYVRCSVYELSKHFHEEFDIILFFGIFYHLKHPILAFEQVAGCLRPGGTLFVEGEGMWRHVESIDGVPIPTNNSIFEHLEALDQLGVPLTASYPGKYLGAENWITPNRSALRSWLRGAGFNDDGVYMQVEDCRCRVGAKATKLRDPTLEHSVIGELDGYQGDIVIQHHQGPKA